MKKIIYPLFALGLLFATSCKKEFFDINDTNPNAPVETDITPQLILPRALQVTAARTGTSFDYAAFWTGYWSRSGSYGQSVEIESYNITTGFQNSSTGQWASWYDILKDENTMENQAKAKGLPFYEAAAKTLKAIGFMYLVDQYNNVPYSKAFDVKNNLLPTYDKGEDIYASLLTKLDSAATLFASATTIDAGTASADIMFGGDTDQWRKLVNTLRLKLLIHESEVVSSGTVSSIVAKINADGSGFLGIGETASVNPGYAVVPNQQNPFYNTYKVTALGVLDNYNRANNYILTKYFGPDGIDGTADDDVRYKFVFSKVRAYVEDDNGDPVLNPKTGKPYDYRGTNFGETLSNADPYRQQNQSDVAGPGLAKSPTQDQPLLTSIESLFLQAEAMQRGWITGAAATTYANAIQESYTYLGAGSAANYLARPDVALTSGGDPIKQISYQKYLSLIGLNNFEAYVDYRRLGVPQDLPLSLNANRNGRVIPLRLQYPQTEYNYNPQAVAAQGSINPQTSRIFWDK